MAISYMITVVVDVGQGQCTFSCIYDTSTPKKIIHTLLFDCGTDKKSPNTVGNIDYIATKLATMSVPAIDLLVFSHSDNDHVSLMAGLLAAYGKTGGATLKVLSTWYAGNSEFYTKDTKNILYQLETDGHCNSFTTPDFGESQYNKKKSDWKKGLIWSSPDKTIQVGMLIGNVIDNEPGVFVKTEFGTVAEKKNRVSIVCALMHDDRSLLICGDATNRTMAWVNDAFGDDRLPKDLMVTLPHHGSRATGLNVSGADTANKKAIDVVKTFVETAYAKTATISAFSQHDHPSMELISYFTKRMATSPVVDDDRLKDHSHFLVCNVDKTVKLSGVSVSKTYHTLNTQTNIYATCYADGKAKCAFDFKTSAATKASLFIASPAPSVNEHACWSIVTFAGSGNKLQGFKSMSRVASNSFTDDSEIPETTTFAGAGPIVSRDGLTPRDVNDVFPAPTEQSSPSARRLPALSSGLFAATPLSRLRAFR